jgi:catechol 2,3-dioxygenase-like lactoylglutathione lyase family enzyme
MIRPMSLRRIAPIFAVHDLDASVAFYRKLGFATRAYEGGGYGFATREGIEIHLGVVPASDDRTSSAYLLVEDADEAAAPMAIRRGGGSWPRGH